MNDFRRPPPVKVAGIDRPWWPEPIPFATLITDLAGRCVGVAADFCALLDVDAEQLRGHGWLGRVFEDDRPLVREHWARAVTVRGTFSLTVRLLKHDGRIVLMHFRVGPRFDRAGEFVGFSVQGEPLELPHVRVPQSETA